MIYREVFRSFERIFGILTKVLQRQVAILAKPPPKANSTGNAYNKFLYRGNP